MAIATINGESCPSGALREADPARAAGPEARPVGSAAAPAVASKRTSLLVGTSAAPTSRVSVPFYKPMPATISFALRVEAFAPSPRGYAPSSADATRQSPTTQAGATSAAAAKAKTSSSSKSSSSKTAKSSTTKSTSAKSSASRELAFLDDKHLSIQDKLFQFMMLMTKKNDQELIDAMKDYEDKKAAQSKSSSASEKTPSSGEKTSSSPERKSVLDPNGGGGLFGFLGDALGSIGKAIVGGAEALAKDLGGPALASVATAFGAPFLAPLALRIGGDLSASLIDGVASTVGLGTSSKSLSASSSAKSAGSSSGTKAASSSAKKTSTTSSTTADPEEFDERLETFKLQRLVEKQNAMFSALTNAMKSMHETQMTAVHNIR